MNVDDDDAPADWQSFSDAVRAAHSYSDLLTIANSPVAGHNWSEHLLAFLRGDVVVRTASKAECALYRDLLTTAPLVEFYDGIKLEELSMKLDAALAGKGKYRPDW
jgi:hypothetical protein